jgi:hypothetical protein
MLCGAAKKMNAGCPCNIFCLDAMEGMIKGLDPALNYKVESTLYSDGYCQAKVTK